MKKLLILLLLVAATGVVSGQNVLRDALHKPLADAWPTYSGDYSGRRFSGLTQIGPLTENFGHTNLHYGNMITYIRMLGLKPPSS